MNLKARLDRLEALMNAGTDHPFVLETDNDSYLFLLSGHPWHNRTINGAELAEYQTQHPEIEFAIFNFNPNRPSEVETVREMLERLGDNWHEEYKNKPED